MKKSLLALAIGVLMTMNYVQAEDNIAVVDLPRVVSQSASVKSLKQEQANKIKELNGIVTKAQAEIAKENDIKKIVEIQEKYTAEYNNKKANIDKVYAEKLSKIEQKILADVATVAKKKGYDMVFAKTVALYGGDDITSEVSAHK